jgi:phosphotransferase system HPr-like phosphotransfer protein
MASPPPAPRCTRTIGVMVVQQGFSPADEGPGSGREPSFADKVRIFSHDLIKCCTYILSFENPQHGFTKKLYSMLISTSQLMEDFLDFHGAKNNTNWYFYRELTAAVRHISLGAYCQKHISNRMVFYDLPDSQIFAQEGERTLAFLNQSLIRLAPVIMAEAQRLEIALPAKGFDPTKFPSITTGQMLAYDIDDENRDSQKKHIVKIASEFLSLAAEFDQLGFYKPYNLEEIQGIVPERVNEVVIRRFEMLVHNLQSAFDTYVIQGGYRYGNRKLKQLRSYFSVVFHLLQMNGRLLHYYERHLHKASTKHLYRQTQDRLVQITDPEALLDRIVNYGLYYACHFMASGKELAREILNENIERGHIQVGIPVKLGFHSRPSLLVAKIVQHYGGQVELVVGVDRFDASSVLDIQWAGGKINKEQIAEVVFEGDVRALRDIEILAAVNYGEDTMGKGVPLPRELAYLR